MSENEKFEEQKSKIVKILTTMFDYLGLSAALRVEERGGRIGVKISSDDAGRIIGRKGQTLESLQLLLNRVMFKDDEDCPHIMLDIDGYARGERGSRPSDSGDDREVREREPREREPREREPREREPREREPREREPREREFQEREPREREFQDREPQEREPREREFQDRGEEDGDRFPPRERRERRSSEDDHSDRLSTTEQLEQQALDAAKEVKRWGESVTLPEMNAHDRRIIHVTLKDDVELTTESLGEGVMKKVVISLRKED